MKRLAFALALFVAPACIRSFAQNQQVAAPTSIVVTGTFDPVAIDELDRSVSILPMRAIQLLSASWLDALRLDPSVDLQERSPNGVQSDISIRGATFGQTLVLVNGIRVNDVQTGHHDLDVPLPLLSIDHVEVLRGSGSALYGSDAVGGVVNFVAKPPEQPEFVLRFSGGNFGVNQQAGSLSFGNPTISEQISFSRDFSTGFQPDRDYRNLAFASTTFFRDAFGTGNMLLGYADKPFGANGFYGDYPSWEDTKTWLAAFQQKFGENTEAVFSYRRHSDLFVLFRDDPPIYTNHHSDEAYLGEIRRSESLGQNARLHYGAEFDRESVVSNNLGDHSRTRGSTYVSMDIRAIRRFSFTAGAREDVYSTTAGGALGQFNPDVAAGYWLNSKLRFRGAASRAFRLPTYTDLYYSDPANLGNALLKPEHAWSFEGGAELQISAGWRAEGTVFQRRDYGGIDYVRQSANEPWQAENFDRLRFTGFEGALTGSPLRDQELVLRFTGIHGYQSELQGFESKYAFNFLVESGTAEYRLSHGPFLFRTRLGASRRIHAQPYALWDAYAAWRRKRASPFLQLTNITNASYQEIPGLAMPGRAVVGGVEIRAWP